ncbi:MAG: HEPN domain-containing protein [Saprospiraceae bacterium]|nr:HEPN domain-containing protein [Saprospiraceae bacterium]
MSYDKAALVQYRLEKADKSIEEALAMAEMEHWNTVANRLYYACFYAITAYFAQQEVKAITHKGIKAAFHQELIKTGLISLELGKFYTDLFNKRQEADYQDFVEFTKATMEPLLAEAILFVEKIKLLIENK